MWPKMSDFAKLLRLNNLPTPLRHFAFPKTNALPFTNIISYHLMLYFSGHHL